MLQDKLRVCVDTAVNECDVYETIDSYVIALELEVTFVCMYMHCDRDV